MLNLVMLNAVHGAVYLLRSCTDSLLSKISASSPMDKCVTLWPVKVFTEEKTPSCFRVLLQWEPDKLQCKVVIKIPLIL